MPDLELCTVQDVVDNSGDPVALRQLLGGDALDTAYIRKGIVSASGQVEASAGNKFNLRYDADPTKYPQVIRFWTAILTLRLLWLWKGQGQATPAHIVTMVQEVHTALQRVEDGKKGVGQNVQPPARVAGYASTDMTRGGTVPRMDLEGLRKGFL
jgi:hypothetical protein